MIRRRGERTWFRAVNRSVNVSTGENLWNYSDNQSAWIMFSHYQNDEVGRFILLPAGKIVAWGRPVDFITSFLVKEHDLLIRNPDNYSAGTAEIYRIDRVKMQPLLNGSRWYVRMDATLTKARE